MSKDIPEVALPTFQFKEIDGRKTLQIDPNAVGAWFNAKFLTRFHMQTKAGEARQIIENSLYSDIVTSVQHELQKLIVEKSNSMEEIQHYRTCLTVLMLLDTKLKMIADMKVDTPEGTGDTGVGKPDIARVSD